MPAYGYEFYLLVVNSISHEWAQRTSEISSWPLEDKIHIHARACNILYVLLWYWTSMIWSTDTCQNEVSADQHHVTISRAQVNSSSRSSVFFEVDRWPGVGFSIGSWAHVWLTCWEQGRIVRKPVNAHPGLNFNRIITFSSMQMFLLLFLCIWWLLKIKTKDQTIYRKPQRKVTKLKSKLYFFLG